MKRVLAVLGLLCLPVVAAAQYVVVYTSPYSQFQSGYNTFVAPSLSYGYNTYVTPAAQMAQIGQQFYSGTVGVVRNVNLYNSPVMMYYNPGNIYPNMPIRSSNRRVY